MSAIKRAVICVAIVLVALAAAGCNSAESPKDIARDNYEKKLTQVSDQQNIVANDISLARTGGNESTMRVVLLTLRSDTLDLVNVTDEADSAGIAYQQYLTSSDSDYAQINNNAVALSSYIDSAKSEYNSAAGMYNKYWAGDGELPGM